MNDKHGRRTFLAGAVALIVTGLTHSLAVISLIVGEPQSEAEAAYRRASEQFVMTTTPLVSNAWGGNMILSASYSVLLIQAGALNLIAVGPLRTAGRLRTATALNLIFAGAQVAIAIAYQFWPPIVFLSVVAGLFAVSLWRQTTATAIPAQA
jgi:hypothetical protein